MRFVSGPVAHSVMRRFWQKGKCKKGSQGCASCILDGMFCLRCKVLLVLSFTIRQLFEPWAREDETHMRLIDTSFCEGGCTEGCPRTRKACCRHALNVAQMVLQDCACMQSAIVSLSTFDHSFRSYGLEGQPVFVYASSRFFGPTRRDQHLSFSVDREVACIGTCLSGTFLLESLPSEILRPG